ncbi:endogenous retrovirus group K member 7 Pro protein-like [Arvicanthis niloticus]|uniref:endogenous retrovirus group K member 7 Pro protein-like n=1 Tax=Arvicanthis niloticus TaxID=61156 RepID=UPI001485C815|nr:endogenous retrovirus group K member 7 Pro protein-like [Arvicanthis niloticus]
MTLNVDGRKFVGLLDTGADKSIIVQKDWPKNWPLQQSLQTLQGLGFAQSPNLSAKVLTWKDDEGHKGQFQPYVLELPISLWGRDLLQALGFTLSNDYSIQAQTMMCNMGWDPSKGLGRNSQGIREPIQTRSYSPTTGLGFS